MATKNFMNKYNKNVRQPNTYVNDLAINSYKTAQIQEYETSQSSVHYGIISESVLSFIEQACGVILIINIW